MACVGARSLDLSSMGGECVSRDVRKTKELRGLREAFLVTVRFETLA